MKADYLPRMNLSPNRRVLLVEDLPSIHEDFRKVLAAAAPVSTLVELEAALFGIAAPEPIESAVFEMDSAYQGLEALEKLKAARREGRPYAMAFIDAGMVPGWDGVETVEQLWKVDPSLQVVLCTAYSDHAWPRVLARLDVRDRLLILKKPFDPIEVYQFANALTTKWNLARQAAFKMNLLEQSVEERTRELTDANIIVRNSPVVLYRLRGEPSLPVIYVSHNITKFGHTPEELIADPEWGNRLIHRDDLGKALKAMARVFEKDAQGASIEFRIRCGEDRVRWVENRYIPIRNRDGALVEIEGILIDITERKAAEDQISRMARTDVLTGLANRATFMERLRQMFAAAKRGASAFAVLYLDLDRFKPVNDNLGHAVGDRLLREVAQRLRECTRETDLVARLGGDEFAILQGELMEPANAGDLARKFLEAIGKHFMIDGHGIGIGVSIGVSPYRADIESSDVLLSQADIALYRAKEEGRGQFRFHSVELDRQVSERTDLALELRHAIGENQLELQYQPQVDLASGRIRGMEALVRWNHPTRGLLTADSFISLAERIGAVVPLERWVLEQACRQMRAWRDEGLQLSVMAVNLSLTQLNRGPELLKEVVEALSRWNLAPSDLEFDVTEGTLAHLKWSQSDVLPKLRELGVQIAIDNFGGEYSSFDYIRAYHINHLKISRSCISRSANDPQSAATVSAIINFARDVGVEVIAQGVENEQQRALLDGAAATAQAQGFHFSAPVGATDAGDLLRAGTLGTPTRGV
jgi:diguanylate cyclase (GGDEF)-like protein/PAS domain S-box-containing protein